MARKKRKVPSINGASSADIAFMLLLFFLLTTSMDTDQGLPRKLPNPPDNKEKPEEVKSKERNVLKVYISSTNEIMCQSEMNVSLTQLREMAKEFIENPLNSENLPEKELVDIPFFGERMITKAHIISLQCDRTTQYQAYLDVQNELAAAYNDLRDIESIKQFGKPYRALDNEDYISALQALYSQKISEAEPKSYVKNK